MWVHSTGQLSSKHTLHNSVLPTVYQWENYEEVHFVQGEEPPHFTLPTHARIENHFPGQWIGCQGPKHLILHHAASFCGTGLKMKYTDQNQENLLNCNNKSEIICCCSSRLLKEKCLSVCLPGCRSVHKILGPMLKSYINGTACALK